jgi:phosphate transport system ATP-binding protein
MQDLQKNGKKMSEQTKNTAPSSLSDVAANRAERKVAGTVPLGTGLEAR